jgi:hypothetical protein
VLVTAMGFPQPPQLRHFIAATLTCFVSRRSIEPERRMARLNSEGERNRGWVVALFWWSPSRVSR